MDSVTLPIIQDDIIDEFFVHRYGRRMSAMTATYPLPVDEDEVKRYELNHRMMQFIFSGRNYIGPVKEALQFGQKRRILDLGTGNGQWAIEMADAFPSAEILGVDCVPLQPRDVPPNCTFEICDLEDAFLPYPSASFDLIHAREIQLGIRDYPRLLKEIARLLRPGGLVLLIESDLEPVVAQEDSESPSAGDVASHDGVGAPSTSSQALASNMVAPSDSNDSHPGALLVSPTPSRPSPWQQQSMSIGALAPNSTAPISHTILTTNRQLNALLNPVPQTPVPIWSSAPQSLSRNSDSSLDQAHGAASVGAIVFAVDADSSASTAATQIPSSSLMPSNLINSRPVSESLPSTSGPSKPSCQPKMQNWLRLWSVFRRCLEGPSSGSAKRDHVGGMKHLGIDSKRPRQLSRMLAETELYEAITVRQANVPVGFWPRDPHLLTVGQLQWMNFELLIPAMRPFLLSRMVSGLSRADDVPSTEEEVDQLIKDAQQDFYSPVSPLFVQKHVVYASKLMHL